MEEVEEEQLQRDFLLRGLDPVDPSEAPHQILEREGLAGRIDRDDLAFQEELGRGQGSRHRDDLG